MCLRDNDRPSDLMMTRPVGPGYAGATPRRRLYTTPAATATFPAGDVGADVDEPHVRRLRSRRAGSREVDDPADIGASQSQIS